MSTFALKIIAVITMFIDHSSILFFNLGLYSPRVYVLLRGIGRMAFPIFCFLLVKGFSYSSDREKYLGRLMSFALISQIPFSLYFSQSYELIPGPFSLQFTGFSFLIPLILWLSLYFISGNKNIKQLIILVLYLILPGLNINLGQIELLSSELSVFYSLSLGLCIIFFISELKASRLSKVQIILAFAALASSVIIIQPLADYGISALILIVGLFLCPSDKLSSLIFIMLWAAFQYGLSKLGLMYCFFVFLSALALYFYNGRKGPSLRYFFYLFYPLHLLALCILGFIF